MTIEPWESLDPKADLLRRVEDIQQDRCSLQLLIDDLILVVGSATASLRWTTFGLPA